MPEGEIADVAPVAGGVAAGRARVNAVLDLVARFDIDVIRAQPLSSVIALVMERIDVGQ